MRTDETTEDQHCLFHAQNGTIPVPDSSGLINNRLEISADCILFAFDTGMNEIDQ